MCALMFLKTCPTPAPSASGHPRQGRALERSSLSFLPI